MRGGEKAWAVAVFTGARGDGLVLFVASAAGEGRHGVLFDGGVERGGEHLVGLCGEGGRSEVVVAAVVEV